MQKITLTPEQSAAVDQMAKSPTGSSLNASLMSAGKTVMAVELMKRLGAQFVLIIAPLNTHTGWQRTLERQGVSLPFKRIDSSKPGKANLSDYAWQLPGIYTIGPELFVRWSWHERQRTKTFTEMHDMVIFDEHHRGSNRKSKTHKSAEYGVSRPTIRRIKSGHYGKYPRID